MTKNKSKLYLLIILILLCAFSGCASIQSSSDVKALKPVSVQTIGKTVIPLDEGESVRERILDNPAGALAWEQKKAMFPAGGRLSTWISQFTLSNSESASMPRGLYSLSSQQPSYGRLLVSNIFHTPHSLGLIFLFDYQPLPIQTESGIHFAYYLPKIPVGAEQAVEFLFPPFPQGLHHLSVVLITDPESESTDPDYRRNQQQSFSEQRFDLWVDLDAIPAEAPSFSSPEQMMSAGLKLPFDIVNLASSSHELIESLQFETDTQNEVGLLFAIEEYISNMPPYTGTLPLRIGVFWNDTLCTAFDYELDPKLKLSEPLLLPITIETPTDPGEYQMQVIAFPIPWHPHYNADGEWIALNHASFSRRIPVSVVEKR